jgi:hypothetical protein
MLGKNHLYLYIKLIMWTRYDDGILIELFS